MNKYLENYNTIIELVKKEFGNKASGEEILYKSIFANEFNCCWCEEELPKEKQEWLIVEMYDFYMSNDFNDINMIVNAFIKTIQELGNFDIFRAEYDLKFDKTIDKIMEYMVW